MEILNKLWQWICKLPKWARAIAITLIAGLVLLASLTSCGPTVKVSARSTTDTVSISISQNVTDSTGVSVSVNPNINISPNTL